MPQTDAPTQTDVTTEETQYNYAAYAVDPDGEYAYLGLYTEDNRAAVVDAIRDMADTGQIHGVAPSEYDEIDVFAVDERSTHPAPTRHDE